MAKLSPDGTGVFYIDITATSTEWFTDVTREELENAFESGALIVARVYYTFNNSIYVYTDFKYTDDIYSFNNGSFGFDANGLLFVD